MTAAGVSRVKRTHVEIAEFNKVTNLFFINAATTTAVLKVFVFF